MNIYETITKIIAEVPAIKKEKSNLQQHFKFRGIDDVMNAINPLFAKYKLFIAPQVLEQTREERETKQGGNLIYSICKIKYTFYAEDGTYIEAITIGEGMDSGDKATNKAMAIAMKYALFQVFCIPTEEMIDPDSESPIESEPLINSTIESALRDLISNNQITTESVTRALAYFKHKKLNELKVSEINDFKKQIGV